MENLLNRWDSDADGPTKADPPIIEHCRPKILIYADSLSFGYGDQNGFNLSIFLAAILRIGWPTAPVRLTLAHRHNPTSNPAWLRNAQPRVVLPVLNNFRFDSAAVPVTRENYDEIWLFGIADNPGNGLSDDENIVIIDFMNSGGGVFATGDHSAIGYGIAGRLPRIRAMRNWSGAPTGTPMGGESQAGAWSAAVNGDPTVATYRPGANDRRDTIWDPGADFKYQFDDQSDGKAQRIFPNYQTVVGPTMGIWTSLPHPLLKYRSLNSSRSAYFNRLGNLLATAWSTAGAYNADISFLPDHAHEGECFEVSSRGGREEWFNYRPRNHMYNDFGLNFNEFGTSLTQPDAIQPAVVVAFSIAAGRAVATGSDDRPGFWKPPVNPRVFGAISAYDGHAVGSYLNQGPGSQWIEPGRVVCDATWHHFINTNLNGEGTGREPGLYTRHPSTGALTPTHEVNQILRYFQNILLWLMPASHAPCSMWIELFKFRQDPKMMHELSGRTAFATSADLMFGGRLLLEYIDRSEDSLSPEDLATSLLRHTGDWSKYAAFLDLDHPTPAPQEALTILSFGFGHALAAHFKRFAESSDLAKIIAGETSATHSKSEAAVLKAFAKGCAEGLTVVVKQADRHAKLLKTLKGAK